ncbi:MAG: DnaJ domain-containing protein [Deltaproteobacteria bacterium]|nr:DnaJ domain-containing protein [Deltaproteobacteria bacterium]
MNLPGNSPQDVAQIKAEIDKMFETVMQKDCFQILGVTQDAAPAVITNAYRQLAKKWHRDAYGAFKLGAHGDKLDEIFSKIAEAHETLTTPAKRTEYMVFLKRKNAGLSTDVNSILKAEELYDNALAAMRKRQFAEAREHLEGAIKLNKEEPLYRTSLGWTLYKIDPKLNLRTALDTLKGAIEMRENNAEAHYYLGEIYVAENDNAEAIRCFKRCLKYDSKHIEAARRIRILGQRQEQKKKSESGITGFFNKLLKR